jgi:hypothetical protein
MYYNTVLPNASWCFHSRSINVKWVQYLTYANFPDCIYFSGTEHATVSAAGPIISKHWNKKLIFCKTHSLCLCRTSHNFNMSNYTLNCSKSCNIWHWKRSTSIHWKLNTRSNIFHYMINQQYQTPILRVWSLVTGIFFGFFKSYIHHFI